MRMIDVQMVWDAADIVSKQPRGARSRTAEKHGVSRATITEAVKRVEAAFNVRLFAKARSDKEEPLTAPGRAFVDHGKTFLESFQLLRKLVQDAQNLD
ncbi:hypothetical protein [Methylobacterium sp. J-068]|uniref:hypothetical protein n=1 Tax=Methylobacterium sp. J-068 TaxID=2836649 RepID=UPI001FB9675D|nr:hypothetical protein [Methylobacterium sp. J-068]MCJ2035531.1 hypothetical protein [Methylobacterium sp. J-068]